MHKWLWILMLLSACTTVGRQVDTAKLSAFEKGKTTRAEVEAAIGKPMSVTLQPDGRIMVMYFFAHGSPRAATFIPIVGAFAGGADVQSQGVTILYDSAGIFQSVTSTTTQSGAGMGMASGEYQP